jgi:hypothetical protein
MKNDETRSGWTRREFTAASVMALLAGVTVTVGCGGGGGGSASPTAPTPAAGDKAGVVSANHGHIAIVMAAQLTAGNAVNLDIHGTADHAHSVQLSADQVRAIALGMRITVRSSADQAHDHDVTFS